MIPDKNASIRDNLNDTLQIKKSPEVNIMVTAVISSSIPIK